MLFIFEIRNGRSKILTRSHSQMTLNEVTYLVFMTKFSFYPSRFVYPYIRQKDENLTSSIKRKGVLDLH